MAELLIIAGVALMVFAGVGQLIVNQRKKKADALNLRDDKDGPR